MRMSTASTDFATAFARLLSSRESRSRFQQDPHGLAKQFGLVDSDLATFLSLDVDELDLQAAGMIDKRMREVSKLIPKSWNHLGGSIAARIFRAYAGQSWPTGHRRHIDDALAFGRFLVAGGTHEVCQAELNQLRFSGTKKRLAARFLRHAIIAGKSRPALQILYRRRGQARYFLLY